MSGFKFKCSNCKREEFRPLHCPCCGQMLNVVQCGICGKRTMKRIKVEPITTKLEK